MKTLLQRAVPLLLKWYCTFKRDLPWRKDKLPYHVWLAEIMLQQTRVEAVKDYYRRFLVQFPTVEHLAQAGEEEVFKAWEGLGYYSRARNLHKTAKRVVELGAFPNTWEEVRALYGVGDYTAGAICSIAYDLPCPAVDGNVLRVLTRLLGDRRNIDDNATKGYFASLLKEVYPKEAGDFCQALMELGAIVCVPNGTPLCEQCPWQRLCHAHLEGKELEFPLRNQKKARKIVEATVFVLKCNDKYALCKREEKGLLAGLWGFPFFEGQPPEYGKVKVQKKAKHIFTHIEWKMTGKLVEIETKLPQYTWATAQEIANRYALPSAFKAFLEWIK